jgi:hypothetical protein
MFKIYNMMDIFGIISWLYNLGLDLESCHHLGIKGSGHNCIPTSCFIASAFLLFLISDVFNAFPGIGGMMLKHIVLLVSKQVVKHVGYFVCIKLGTRFNTVWCIHSKILRSLMLLETSELCCLCY